MPALAPRQIPVAVDGSATPLAGDKSAIMLCRSRSHNPVFNLACEEWLLREYPGPGAVLFLYRNRRAVVIGRNQNPWQECDLPDLCNRNIPVLRRCSGGGTVYHDLGNCNFTLIGERRHYQPGRHLEMAVQALDILAVRAEITPRRDIVCNHRKISGSAFTLTSQRVLQHATMLIDSDLPKLKKALQKNHSLAGAISSRAVDSVPSSIINIREITATATTARFEEALIQVFQQHHSGQPLQSIIIDESRPTVSRMPGLDRYIDLYQSPEWQIGRTPDFTATWQTDHGQEAIKWFLQVHRGLVRQIKPQVEEGQPLPQWAAHAAQAISKLDYFWPNHLRKAFADIRASASSPDERQAQDKLHRFFLGNRN